MAVAGPDQGEPASRAADAGAMPRVAAEVVDAIVAGGGIAGACAAVALARRGLSVLVVEPGMTHSRRLVGELLHPPALDDLRSLGLGDVLAEAGAQPVRGFAVFFAGDREVATNDTRCVLAYDEGEGASVEHGALATALLARAQAMPGVTVEVGARVDAMRDDGDRVVVAITRGSERREVSARLVVAADGRASVVRKLGGLAASRTKMSTMAGYVVTTDTLPCPAHGHIFVSGDTPLLAYALAPGKVRVMIDVADVDVTVAVREAHRLAALPEPFRAAVADALATQHPLIASTFTVVPEALARGRVVLVGDAAGCCHPVSASGIASAARDARVLAEELARSPSDVPLALRRYARARQGPHNVRIALASALYRAFAEPSPEMALLRRGLIAYWARSPRGRRVSMALLATAEQRFRVLAQEYAHVAGRALPTLFDRDRPRLPRRRAVRGLLASVAPHVRGAMYAMWPHRERRDRA